MGDRAPQFSSTPRSKVVEEGHSVLFQCHVEGAPKPLASWYKVRQSNGNCREGFITSATYTYMYGSISRLDILRNILIYSMFTQLCISYRSPDNDISVTLASFLMISNFNKHYPLYGGVEHAYLVPSRDSRILMPFQKKFA